MKRIAILADFPLHVIPDLGPLPPPSGHYATWLPQLALKFQNAHDFEIHWIVVSDKISASREILWNRQEFHLLPTSASGRASTLFSADRRAINRLLQSLKPDLVHGWGTEDVYSLSAVTSGFRNIVSMQGILTHYILKSRMHPRNYFQALLEFFVLWHADRLTAESTWGKNILRLRNPFARVSIVEYGVQPLFFDVKWQPDPKVPAAIFLGSVSQRKGIQDLVKAFRAPTLAQAELWVVGGFTDQWGENLRAYAPSNIRWLGRKTPEETASLLGRAWCLALPTRADTSPNAVKEARVIGLPVITTRCGGQAAYVEHGKNGFLVRPGDIPSLTRSLEEIFSSLPHCKTMGSHGHAEHRRILDPMETANRFLELYSAAHD